MTRDDVMTSKIEEFNDTDFGYWKIQIEDYLNEKKFHLPSPGKRPKKIDSLPGNQTWKLMELPLEKKTLHNKFVYRVKTALDGSKRYNAILVENSFSKRQDIAHTVRVISENMSNPGNSLEVQSYVDDDMSIKGITFEKLKLC